MEITCTAHDREGFVVWTRESALALAEPSDFDFEPPRLGDELARPADLS